MAALLSKAWQGYIGVLSCANRSVGSALGRQGRFVARRPVAVLITVALLVAACSAGWARIHSESKSDKLWVPQDSPPMRYRGYVQDTYGSTENGAQVYGSARPVAGLSNDVVNLEATWELFQLHNAIANMSASISPGWPTENDTTITFEDICFRTQVGACGFTGYLQYWNSSFARYLSSVDGSAADPGAGNRSALLSDVNSLVFPDGSSANPLAIFGGLSLESGHNSSSPPTLTGAFAVSIGYGVAKAVPDRVADAWYNAFADLLKARAAASANVTLNYMAANSVDKAIGDSIGSDIYLIAISVAIFIVLAVVFLSSWDSVFTRTSLALTGIVAIIFGIVAGYGLSMLIGLPFTSLQQTLPYILEGIGLDVIFILVKGLDELDFTMPGLTRSQRFERLMETAGLSVAVVAATNVVAFGLGAITAIPAIHWFSIFATISVATNFVVLTTFFLAAFVLNERRIAAYRVDCCCCIVSARAKADAEAFAAEARPDGQEMQAMDVAPQPQPQFRAGPAPEAGSVMAARRAARAREGIVHRFISNWYTPFLLSKPVKALVLAVFFAYLGVSIAGIYKVDQGQPIEDLCPDGSYVIPFQKVNTDYFDKQSGDSTELFFRGVDQSAPAVQAAMLAALNETVHTDYFNATLSAFADNWLLGFIQWVEAEHPEVALTSDGCFNPYVVSVQPPLGALADPQPIGGCVPQASFYPLLTEWLASPAGTESRNNVIRSGNGTIVTSQLGAVHSAPNDEGKYDSNAYNALRETQTRVNRDIFKATSTSDDDVPFFIYTSDYIFWAGSAQLPKAALDFAIYAVVGVGAVLLVLLVHPLTTLLMMGCVAAVIVFLFGELWILGLRFNDVSVINIITATGLAVDYSVYIAVKFSATPGVSRNERVAKSMQNTGAAVALGGITALIGTLPLAAASSTILRTFFDLLFGTILFSLLVGLVFLPVALSLIGPAYIAAASRPMVDLPVVQPHDAGAVAMATSKASGSASSSDGSGHKPGIAGEAI